MRTAIRWQLAAILLAVWTAVSPTYARGRKACPQPPCRTPWSGIYPTVLTPFLCEGGVDTVSLERQIKHELCGGVHGLLVLGTIGEGQYVDEQERAQVITTAVRAACKRPVVVGIHTCDVDLAKQQLLQARDLGAAAVLVKYAGHPHASAAEVLGFMTVLSEQNVLPIFYYHYPSQTGLRLSAAAIASILDLPNVVGIKESTLDLREVQSHMGLVGGQGKTFLSGTALNLTQFMDLGGHGAMCPEAVLLPGPTVQAHEDYLAGNYREARAIQKELFVVLPILSSRSTPTLLARPLFMAAEDHKLPLPMGNDHPQARLKYALNCLGVPTPPIVKCPMPPLTRRDKRHVDAAVCRIKDIDWSLVGCKVPPVPLRVCPTDDEGGMLLRTAPFQLGAGVGRDLLRSQGDGRGF